MDWTYQWTKALLAYIRSNLWSNLKIKGIQVYQEYKQRNMDSNCSIKYFFKESVSYLAQASAMAVVLESMHTARCTFARSPPGITVGGW